MKSLKSGVLKNSLEGYLFIGPWLIGFLIFTLWPMIQSMILSFSSYDAFTPIEFIGFDNFKELFFEDKLFWHTLKVTSIYVLLSVPLKLAVALLVAMILNQKIRGISFYRTIYYLPSIVGAGVAMSVTWKMVMSREGYINTVLGYLGMGPFDFLSSPDIALGTLSFMGAWQFGSSMVIFLAGLKIIPNELYEAAKVDGSSKLRQFFNITLPLLSPTIFFNLIMGIINAFQVFTQAFVTTQGGPLHATYMYVMHLYKTAFQSFRLGYSSALAWILTLIILGLTVVVFRTSQKWVYYES